MSRRLAIDLVSPLPPVRSGIADYSRDLLPHLDPLCDLRVIALPGQEVAEEIASRWQPRSAADTGEHGRLPLYEMGNNHHHEEVLRLALERPGVATLHDLVLHHLLVESTLGHGDIDGYRERLAADHGWIGETTAVARRWGELGSACLFELPANRTLIRRQRGILVHSDWAAEQIREQEGDVAVRTVPMGVPLGARPEPERTRDFRRRHGLPLDRPLLGSFGFQTPIKRTEVVVRALAAPGLTDAHLVIVGEVSGVLDLEGLAERLGVASRVHVTGFIDFADFETAIGASDVAINLRYPTAGETSASLLRVLAVGRPVAVSEYAQFAELPDEVAVKTPLGDGEAEALAAVLGELLASPDRLAAMASAARDFVRDQHDPSRAAARIVAACAELAELEPPGDRAAAVPVPSTLTWSEIEGRVEVEGAEAPWPVGESRRVRITLENEGFCRWLATSRGPGGVLVEILWRGRSEDAPPDSRWEPLPRDLEPAARYRFETELRRPPGTRQMVVGVRVEGTPGFGEMGGPTWVGDYAGG